MKLIGISLLLLVVSDLTYTYVFYKSLPRNKLQFVLKNEYNNYDNVFIGSSRVANHIDVKYLDSLSGLKNLNLGVEGANYADNLLMLELFVNNNNKVDQVFLQLDHFYENSDMSAIANSDALPFIHNEIINNYFEKYNAKYYYYYYIPFYRYQSADFKIGFREFFMNAINKKAAVDFNYGYIPKYNSVKTTTYEKLPSKIATKNIFVDEIITFCKENNIKLVLFSAPFNSHVENLSYIKKLNNKFPDLYDYSASINDDFFYNSTHLNNVGAKKFTYIIYEKHIKNGK